MPNLKRLLAVSLLLTSLAYGCVSDWAVNPDYTALQNAVQNACPGGRIFLASGMMNFTGQIIVDKDLSILGGSATVLNNVVPSGYTGGALGNRFFVVIKGAHLILERLTLNGGLGAGGNGGNGPAGGGGGAAGMGGAIFVDDDSGLALKSVSFTGNRAIAGQGGDYTGSGSDGGGGGGFGGDAQGYIGGSGGPINPRGRGGNGSHGTSVS